MNNTYIYLAVKAETLNNNESAIIFKIGETNNISRRKYEIKKNDNDTIVKFVAIKNDSEKYRRMIERIAQNVVMAKFGKTTKSIGNDHFVTVEKSDYARVYNGFEKIVEFANHRGELIVKAMKGLEI